MYIMIIRDDERVKRNVASNIAHYRKECNLTQDELAEMIFYSGKSVSKWERGEGVPDICVLVMLAEIFGVTVNDMIEEKPRKRRRAKPQVIRNLITLMSIAAVWLIATVCFFILRISAPAIEKAWLAFIIAIPVMFVVAIVFSALWQPPLVMFGCISGLVWSLATTLHLFFHIENMFLIYVIAAVLQLLIVLWYLLVNTKLFAGVKTGLKTAHRQGDDATADTQAAEAQPLGDATGRNADGSE